MRADYIHIVFVVDESGSMYSLKNEIIDNFNNFISEQKTNKGLVKVSIYTFNNNVKCVLKNENIHEANLLTLENYKPNGLTALYDAIETGIDETGEYLASLDENERPSQVLFVILTDGLENFSSKATLEVLTEKISHQENKYSWQFIYLGNNLTDNKQAKDLKIKNSYYIDGKSNSRAFSHLSSYVVSSMACDNFSSKNDLFENFKNTLSFETKLYEKQIGKKIENYE